MSCYFLFGIMLWVLCMLQSKFYMACGCVPEEKIALMQIRSSLMEAKSQVPASWGGSDDCCSWDRVVCNSNARVSELHLSEMSDEVECWNLNLTIFSPFHDLQLLDLYGNTACLQSPDGLQGLTKLRYINLSENSFIGNGIMGSLGKLISLEVINLDGSKMGGPLQTIAFENLKKLRELHLQSNLLNGSIPASLFELPSLVYLDLSENLLQGHVPMSSSSNLSSSLETLKLSKNNLNGVFDFFWLRNCAMLKNIDLSGNAEMTVDVKFRGRAPPFQLRSLMLSGCNIDNNFIAGPNFLGAQRHLDTLVLSNNNLTGSIPSWIFTSEAGLVHLDLSNNLLVGSLDHMWRHQSSLQVIKISMNRFEGQLPTNISSVFPSLKVLDASHNTFSGDLPPSLCNISQMNIMDLSNNKFTGEVPTCLFTDQDTLSVLKLSNNNLGGPIFGGASELSIKDELYLGCNNFEAALPSNLSGPMAIMDLRDNKLSGELDVSFWDFHSLQILSVASNRLSGEIYPAICMLTTIWFLDLSDNNFAGSVPNCNSKLPLTFLNMSGNSLSGFPGAFFTGSDVMALDLRYNQFTGTLDWIQSLAQITLLLLGGNRFEGRITPNLCHLQYLSVIDFSHNRLSGSLPPCIGDILFESQEVYRSFAYRFAYGVLSPDADHGDAVSTYDDSYDLQGFTFFTKGNLYTYGRKFFGIMFGIDLSGNMLSGEIPWQIGNLSHVKSLNLSYNFFTGRIPATFSNMSSIESLDLSHNELTGAIPWQLTRLWTLEVFSVAYNNLSGCIPDSGQFGSFSMDSYQGNKNLRNRSLGNGCSPRSGPVAPAPAEVGVTSDDPVLYVVSAASFVLSFWATVAFSFCHSYGRAVMLKL